MPLSTQMGAGDYNLVQGRGAITNLSSSRREALGINCDTSPFHLQQAHWSSWGLSLLIMEIGAKSQQF